MRQPAIDPAPALRSLIAALPDDRLREFVLEMLLASLPAKAPASRRLERLPDGQERPAEQPLRRRGWPRGKPRGRPRKAATGAAPTLAQRQRDAERKREKRAAARAVRQANSPSKTGVNAVAPNGSNGTEAAATKSAAKLWQHVEKLQPKAPWRAIVREFGINEALAQDAYRSHTLPLGLTGNAVTHFLELPAS